VIPTNSPADLADAVSEAALACPGVVRLASDASAATYLPGRRVDGVSLTDEVCEVAVVLRLGGAPLPELAERVRAAVEPLVGARRVDIVIRDVDLEVAEVAELDGGVGSQEPV
jgi:hypothetical protein